jgi:hypothetical protein
MPKSPPRCGHDTTVRARNVGKGTLERNFRRMPSFDYGKTNGGPCARRRQLSATSVPGGWGGIAKRRDSGWERGGPQRTNVFTCPHVLSIGRMSGITCRSDARKRRERPAVEPLSPSTY